MNTAELCWLIFLGVIVLVAVITFLSLIPEMRRYFHSAICDSSRFRNFNDFVTYVSESKK